MVRLNFTKVIRWFDSILGLKINDNIKTRNDISVNYTINTSYDEKEN